MKSRIHEVIVKIQFDKPCTRSHAVAEFRDNVHGDFYPTCYDAQQPEMMKIKSVRSAARDRRKTK